MNVCLIFPYMIKSDASHEKLNNNVSKIMLIRVSFTRLFCQSLRREKIVEKVKIVFFQETEVFWQICYDINLIVRQTIFLTIRSIKI